MTPFDRATHPIFRLEALSGKDARYRLTVSNLASDPNHMPCTIAGLAFRISTADRVRLLGILSHRDIRLVAGSSTAIELGIAGSSTPEELTLFIDDISWHSYGEVVQEAPVTLRACAPPSWASQRVPNASQPDKLRVPSQSNRSGEPIQVSNVTEQFDVFLSYHRYDQSIIQKLAKKLVESGFSVWFDGHIAGGERFRDVINSRIDSAQAAIVLWSETSITSDWVQYEAARAHSQNKMIPLCVSPLTTDRIAPYCAVLNIIPLNDFPALERALVRMGVTRRGLT